MMRSVVSRTGFRGRRHIDVHWVLPSGSTKIRWYLCWAEPTRLGYKYGPPIGAFYDTKKAAVLAKREIRNGDQK